MAPVRYCTICRAQVLLKRIMRASPYCSDECRRQARKEMRELKAQRACRLCGRPPLTRKKPGCDFGPIRTESPSEQSIRMRGANVAENYARNSSSKGNCPRLPLGLLDQIRIVQSHDERTALVLGLQEQNGSGGSRSPFLPA